MVQKLYETSVAISLCEARQSINMRGWGTHLMTAPVSRIDWRITCISIAVRLSSVHPTVFFTKWSNSDFASTTHRLCFRVSSVLLFAKAITRWSQSARCHSRRSNFSVIRSLYTVVVQASSLSPFDKLWDSAANVELAMRCVFPERQWNSFQLEECLCLRTPLHRRPEMSFQKRLHRMHQSPLPIPFGQEQLVESSSTALKSFSPLALPCSSPAHLGLSFCWGCPQSNWLQQRNQAFLPW